MLCYLKIENIKQRMLMLYDKIWSQLDILYNNYINL